MKVMLNIEEQRLYPDLIEFPTELMSEKMANAIHGQTLGHLDSRGGMSLIEIQVNMVPYSVYINNRDAVREIFRRNDSRTAAYALRKILSNKNSSLSNVAQ